ncbi:hypothetical protein LCD52_16460 [Rossellomorea vietnamensis]|uniref:hypothetical protein n=1 Tax=Rossellomorea vietnamensis TaxID=218284 RepID=UPI001CCE9034|nr:hypothetical protein [Rossellomorea vietnamensis]MCA0150379.1 hypothetical protein [Rossellomorea vietnamensis]
MNRTNISTISKHTIKVGILYVLYRILLDFIYLKWVSPIFGYSGFVKDPNIFKVFVSYLVIFLFIIIIPKTNKQVSYMIIQLHFIIMIIPLTSIFGLANLSTKFMVMILLCFAIQVILLKSIPLFEIRKIRNAKKIVVGFTLILTIITYVYLFLTQGINFSAFNISNIYSIRSEQANLGLMGYLVTWQYRIINPSLLVISYMKKKYKLSVLSILLQITLFLMFPHKEVFLSVGLITLILLIGRFQYKFDSVYIYILAFSSILFIYIYEVFENLQPLSVLPVRLLYVPALIKFQHYEFFSINEKLYYSEGMIGNVFGLDYPYSIPSGFLIGGSTNNANTGYLAYAFDNAGFLGMVLMSIIFVFLLVLIDSLVKYQNKYLIFALFVYPIAVLNDGDLLTLLLTGGLWLLIIILLVFNDINFENNKKGLSNEKENIF